jgi:hypothetical protein
MARKYVSGEHIRGEPLPRRCFGSDRIDHLVGTAVG